MKITYYSLVEIVIIPLSQKLFIIFSTACFSFAAGTKFLTVTSPFHKPLLDYLALDVIMFKRLCLVQLEI